MKKILTLLVLALMLTSCGSYVNTSYTEPQTQPRNEYYQNYFSSMQNQNFDNIEQPIVDNNTTQTNISVNYYVTPNGYFNMNNIYSNYFYGSNWYYRPYWHTWYYPNYFYWNSWNNWHWNNNWVVLILITITIIHAIIQMGIETDLT